jgi:hypothetical protein
VIDEQAREDDMSLRALCRWIFITVLIIAVAACGRGREAAQPAEEQSGAAEQAAPAVDPATAGAVNGSVLFTGTAPEPEVISMDAEPGCQEQYTEGPFSESVVVNDNGTLANVFVYVKSGLEGQTFPTPSEPVLLDQKGCRYIPHVLGVQTNQTLVIRNSDDNLHNIHPMPVNNRPFNIGQPTQGMETERTFEAAEVMIPVSCDVHGWMSASIGVLDHPYFAVTGDDGSFSLPNLPPGDYVVEAWHEEYGTQTAEVTVGESETVEIELTFAGG